MTDVPLATLVRHLRSAALPRPAEGTDHQLLQDFARHNDSSAFAALVRRHGPAVLGVCRRVLRQEQDAEDAFQACFLVLARKAGSVRKGGSLASFLHGVSYRIAMRAKRDSARRRKHEAQARPAPHAPPGWESAWREVQGILDEEVERLPQAHRAVFVLCCLNGLSKPEAARQLGLKEGTVSSRLAGARKRLRERLTARGISLSAVLAALGLSSGAKAALPAKLAEATAGSALKFAVGSSAGTGIPAKVLSLAEGALKTMSAPKLKFAALVLALGLLGAGSALLYQRHASAGEPAAPAAKPAEKAEKPAPPAGGKSDEKVTLSGTVVGPDGKPVKGAEVRVWAAGKRGRRATTDDRGRFRLEVGPKQAQGAQLIASARGVGPDWVGVGEAGKGKELTLRLAKDDVPITGRILDLEGRPVAGAAVRVQSLRKPAGADLAPWLDQARRGRHEDLPRLGADALGRTKTLTAGKDGRFRLEGFGRERLVGLHVEGPGIQQVDFSVITRPKRPAGMRDGYYGVYGATFDILVGPGRAITGTVREKGSGKPLAGITVASAYRGWVITKTDARGRYRIDGVGKYPEYMVSAGGLPYFNCTKMNVPDKAGLAPIEVNFELEKGVVVSGRLTDKLTGKPVRGRVHYAACSDNPHLKEYADLGKLQLIAADYGGVAADGTFRALAIPGRGALCVQADDVDRYVRKAPPGLNLGRLVLEAYHAVVPVNVSPEDPKSLKYDITLEPGRTLPGTVVDPDGKPLPGAYALGLSAVMSGLGEAETLKGADFRVGGLDSQPRALFFFHPGRKLARLLTVRKDDPAPLRARLGPLGTLTGRIVAGSESKPQADVKVRAVLTLDFKLYGKELPKDLLLNYPSWDRLLKVEATTGKDGRFRLEGLVPGLKYSLRVGERREPVYAANVDHLTVESGKVTDAGDFNTSREAKKR
jgi:RNA polymerase sigma factor (sigma-70 family)